MATQLPIPFFSSLAEIYPSESAVLRERKRWNELAKTFEVKYGARPTHIIRAPGRVNILGEHIDYSLFPVLPAAIEQDILLALRVTPTSPPTVRLNNVLPKFRPATFALTPPASSTDKWQVDFVSPKQGGGWDNYVKVAFAQCLEEFFHDGRHADVARRNQRQSPVGMDVLVDGSVPAGAGLSSSAGFVVSAVTMFLIANGLTQGITQGDLVGLAMASEHRMGLNTGGMDVGTLSLLSPSSLQSCERCLKQQAASVLCMTNALLHLSFYPTLYPEPLPLPSGVSVVITNSLAPHVLTDSAPEHYNLRVVESLCAARLLLHSWGLDNHPSVRGKTGGDARLWLREVLEFWVEGGVTGANEVEVYNRALGEVNKVLGADGKADRGWTREEMIEASGMTKEEFTSTYLDFIEIRAETFFLSLRAQHALTESIRVSQFKSICQSPSPSFTELGRLISASHESCRDIYDCTHPVTDGLQELCLAEGALGARQTGGGWGGAVISLVRIEEQARFLQRIKDKYTAYQGLSEAQVEEAAFATLPGSGAGVYVYDGAIKP